MSKYGTTKKQFSDTVARLASIGVKAWGTAQGHHYLWVASPVFPSGTGRLSVPSVDTHWNALVAAQARKAD